MGWQFTKITVEKKEDNGWKPDDGHLKGYIGETKASNPPQLSSGYPTFATLDFGLEAFSGKPLTIELFLLGRDLTDDSVVELNKKISYTNVMPTPNKLQGIGSYLASLGMTVTYPTNKTMHAVIAPSNLAIDEAHFAVYEETIQSSPATWSSTFSFDPN